MASIFRPLSVNLPSFIFITSLLILSLPNAVTSISHQELESAISKLRSNNYNLFSNAITTSDILYDVVSNTNTSTSFTFFAPSDSSLFALDMASTASFYTQTLRYHVIPGRFSVSNLRTLPSGSFLPTLLHHREVLFSRRQMPESDILTVNGIDVVVPGLFYGRDVAVHGLASILNFRSHIRSRHSSPPPPPPVNSFSFPPKIGADSLYGKMVFPPVNVTSVSAFRPVNFTILPLLPEVPPVNSTKILPPLPNCPPVNLTILPPLPPSAPVNLTILPPSPPSPPVNPKILSPAPETPSVNELSPANSPGAGHVAPQVQPQAALVSENWNNAVPVPSYGATWTISDPNAGQVSLGMEFSKRCEVPLLAITGYAPGAEVSTGNILGMKPAVGCEQEAETLAIAAERYRPLNEETVESQPAGRW